VKLGLTWRIILQDHARSAHRTDVVIVAHNSGPLLAEAVSSAVEQAGADHVWVVDAESTDGSVGGLPIGKTGPHVIAMPNRGFAAGNNRGMEQGDAPFVLLLNPDAALLPGALAALEGTADAYPHAGIVGALVLDTEDRVQAGSYGRFPSLASVTGLHLWNGWQRLRGNSGLSPVTQSSTMPVDWVTGAAMLVRRQAIAEVGPLDEGFFLYYEDVDWCWWMSAAGWQVLLEPTAKTLHHLGGSNTSQTAVSRAYRDSFYRYCDLHGLWGLRAVSRLGLAIRRLLRGRS
jgi:N-acetylglucosaminyl-diphospho-decaprenol L-rhamnosyltransferase